METVDLVERLDVLLESDDCSTEAAHEENSLFVTCEDGTRFLVTVAKVSE